MPSAIRLLELAEYFDVTPRYLLGMDKICSKNHEERDFAEFLFKSLDKNQKINSIIPLSFRIVSRIS